MSYDPNFEPPQTYEKLPKKERGCFFWGCITVIVLCVVGSIVICGGVYWFWRYAVNTAKEYTDTAPMPIPPVNMPEEQRQELRKRMKAYGDAVNKQIATEPIVLTSDDVNALIDDNEAFRGKAHVEIVGDKIHAEISYPMESLPPPFNLDELKGRYFNGKATLQVSLLDGYLDIRAQDIEVRGKPLPENMKKGIEGQNLVQPNSIKDPEARAAIAKIKSIVVKDGKVIVTPRSLPKTEGEASDKTKEDMKAETEPKPKDEAKPEADAKPKDDAKPEPEAKPKDDAKPETEAGAPQRSAA